MIVTYNWLKEFVDFQFSAQELCDRLTMIGLEVDALVNIGGDLDSVIVAQLDSVDPHPDADRLTVCQVNTGTEVVQVVCGATNHKTGDLVALAQPGSVLPGHFKIKKSKIRGQVSQGMLCSEKELALAEDSPGIMILPENLPLGQPVFDALGLKDYQIEIGLTPNRPDCLSIVGVAREVAALCGEKLKLPKIKLCEADSAIGELTSVTIKNPDGCPRYAARMIKEVKIGPSPDWMVRRLEAVGMRSINNVVDVTNYVMLELGHPLHAFDFNKVKGGEINVKTLPSGTKFTTLDGVERELHEDDLMICDAEKPMCIAGVFGGITSGVTKDTTSIFLESAYFNPVSIRKSAKRHALNTDASCRFERGIDPNITEYALLRATLLIQEISGGDVTSEVIDIYPKKIEDHQVFLNLENAKNLIGEEIP
ncbi:MAG: phenylalanine--tRNA ligase subunit beta, partial [Desulfuromusa sp.]|nr:phenylalanine--tRNA ligase subunit beta [Desulfuromusa sp.]